MAGRNLNERSHSAPDAARPRRPGKAFDRSLVGVCEAVGGIEAFRGISRRFHARVEADPALRGFFPRNMRALEERLALYLAERTGGPADYSATRGKTSLLCRHAHLALGTAEAERWLEHMSASMVEEGVSEATRSRLLANLADLAATLADPLVHLYRLPLVSLRRALEKDPSLALANHHGRNLICAAASAWDVPRMHVLLEFGANADARDGGGHNPLYRVANGRGSEENGRAAVELLLGGGVEVNRATGVGGMTALHMAARRGTIGIAEALLGAGADIEARDRNGETPLRRAVNCGQEKMVRFLLSRGADPLSPDRNGRTPRDAARTESVRRALEGPRNV